MIKEVEELGNVDSEFGVRLVRLMFSLGYVELHETQLGSSTSTVSSTG